jgi:hypothetical protein
MTFGTVGMQCLCGQIPWIMSWSFSQCFFGQLSSPGPASQCALLACSLGQSWLESNMPEHVANMCSLLRTHGATSLTCLPCRLSAHARYWRLFGVAIVCGCALGVTTIGFVKFTDWLPEQWDWYPTSSDDVDFGAGEWWWVGLTAGAGGIIGAVSHVVGLPETIDGFFAEVEDADVDYKNAPKVRNYQHTPRGCLV